MKNSLETREGVNGSRADEDVEQTPQNLPDTPAGRLAQLQEWAPRLAILAAGFLPPLPQLLDYVGGGIRHG